MDIDAVKRELALRRSRPEVTNRPSFPYDPLFEQMRFYLIRGWLRGKQIEKVVLIVDDSTALQYMRACAGLQQPELFRCDVVDCREATENQTHNGQEYLLIGMSGGYLSVPKRVHVEITFSAPSDANAVIQMWAKLHKRLISEPVLLRCEIVDKESNQNSE